MKASAAGAEYLLHIFTGAIGHDDVAAIRTTTFAPGNILQPYHSPNVDIGRRIQYLD
jgi:hypothetical protein